MARVIKQVRFSPPFPLYGPQATTKDQWHIGATNKTGKKKGPKGEMVPAADVVQEDSIGIVFTVYDANGNSYTRRCPWPGVLMVEYEDA